MSRRVSKNVSAMLTSCSESDCSSGGRSTQNDFQSFPSRQMDPLHSAPSPPSKVPTRQLPPRVDNNSLLHCNSLSHSLGHSTHADPPPVPVQSQGLTSASATV